MCDLSVGHNCFFDTYEYFRCLARCTYRYCLFCVDHDDPDNLSTPYLVHERVSQSVVEFTDECISVTDRHGRCWRTIRYTEISKVQVEKVTGFFFGQNKEKWCTEHICFYLTDSTDVPAVSYAKLYKHKDFFMMGYQKETVALLKKMLPHKFYGEEREISTES